MKAVRRGLPSASPTGGGTIAEALRRATAGLTQAGIEEPRREARLLLAAAMGVTATEVLAYPERPLQQRQSDHFDTYVERRARREPAARILGHREFWSLHFVLSPETLVP